MSWSFSLNIHTLALIRTQSGGRNFENVSNDVLKLILENNYKNLFSTIKLLKEKKIIYSSLAIFDRKNIWNNKVIKISKNKTKQEVEKEEDTINEFLNKIIFKI